SRVSPRLLELARLHRDVTAAGVPVPSLPVYIPLMLDQNGRVLIRINASDVAGLRAPLAAFGFQETGALPQHHLLEGYIPIDQIRSLDSLWAQGLMGVSPVWRPHKCVGTVTSQADDVLNAVRVRAALPTGFDGTGVKIGVLSDSYNFLGGANDGVDSGDLPAGVQVLQDDQGNDEGRGMMELIHDLAPGSPLMFATANAGEASFANNIKALKDAG